MTMCPWYDVRLAFVPNITATPSAASGRLEKCACLAACLVACILPGLEWTLLSAMVSNIGCICKDQVMCLTLYLTGSAAAAAARMPQSNLAHVLLVYEDKSKPDDMTTCMRAMATVSPNSICIAVDVTGARSKGHSSRSSGKCTCKSHSCSNLQPRTDVTLTILAPFACRQQFLIYLALSRCQLQVGREHCMYSKRALAHQAASCIIEPTELQAMQTLPDQFLP